MLRKQIILANHQSGFTLIEVLVAIIVLAIGLLGLANLQTVSLRNNQSAYLRTQAIWLANDIVDRIRSNMQFKNKVFTDIYNNVNPAQCSNNSCTQQQIAANDLYEWTNAIRTVLPGGVGTICIDSNPNDNQECDGVVIGGVITYVVNIRWNDPALSNALQVFKMSFQIV